MPTDYLIALFWKCWKGLTGILPQLSILRTYQTREEAALGRLMSYDGVLLARTPEKQTDHSYRMASCVAALPP